jgi:hydantoinase/carbamoylase family amidase
MLYTGQWIEDCLNELAGKTTGAHGIWRAAYTKEDRIAKNLVGAWMESAGLVVREDAMGNLYGRLEGKIRETVLAGSHLDTVKNGGKYDGAAGILTAVAALARLKAEGRKPRKSLEVVALLEEEGSRYGSSYLGSKAIAGKLEKKDLEEKDADGISVANAMKQAGYPPEKWEEARRDDISAYIELHIEQGPVLDKNRIELGIVENIVGIFSYAVTVKGMQNHAGTTPMRMRLDPVAKTAEWIRDITEYVGFVSRDATLTVGAIEAFPGVSNVIAGEVRFSLDFRADKEEDLLKIERYMDRNIRLLELAGFDVSVEEQCREMPVRLDEGLVALAEEAARKKRVRAIRMNSGAGHDAQILADKVPACMIFIPSRDGISHSPLEFTSLEELETGRIVLEELLRELAQ